MNPHIFADAAQMIRDDPEGAMELLADIDPISWIAHIALKNEKGDPIEFKDHMPLVQVYGDFHPEQVYQKGAQIGMTNTAINKVLWLGDHNNLTMIYTMPTADDVYKFSNGRFSPVIRDNFYLRKRMKHADNATQKQIGNSWIYFKGAQVERQAISIPADGLIVDEYDFSDQGVIDTFQKRLIASKAPFAWHFSTPTIPGYGINGLFQMTDQQTWLIQCTGCNKWQSLDFWKNVKPRKGRHIFACSKCGKLLRRRNGLWVAKYPDRASDAVYDARGRVTEPAAGRRGYFVNPLTFTFITAEKKWQEWKTAEKSTRANAIKNFYNYNLGMPFVSGESLITEETIRKTMQPEVAGDGFNVFGCDQGDLLHWVVKHISPDGKMPIIAFGIAASFEEAYKAFLDWNCRVGIVDALPNKHSARSMVQKAARRLYMAYYKDQNETAKERIDDKRKDKDKEQRGLYSHSKKETQTLMLDRSETMDMSAKAWIDGRAYLAKSRESMTEDVWEFIRQMQGSKRDIQEDSKGNMHVVWVKITADHYRHADNYANIAAELRRAGSSSQIAVGGSITNMVAGEDFMPNSQEMAAMFAGPSQW